MMRSFQDNQEVSQVNETYDSQIESDVKSEQEMIDEENNYKKRRKARNIKKQEKNEEENIDRLSYDKKQPTTIKLTELMLKQLDQFQELTQEQFERHLNLYTDNLKIQVMKNSWNKFLKNGQPNIQHEDQIINDYIQEKSAIIECLDDLYDKIQKLPLTEEFQQIQTNFIQNEKVNHYVVNPSFRCQHCNDKFFSVDDLKNHLEQEQINLVVCRLCGRQFVNQRYLETHHGVKHSFKFECKRCNLTFPTEVDSWIHYEICHSEKYKKNICKYCGRQYCDTKVLRKHVVQAHKQAATEEIKREKESRGF